MKKKSRLKQNNDLRCRAEEQLCKKKVRDVQKMEYVEAQVLVRNLQVHQVELERQAEKEKKRLLQTISGEISGAKDMRSVFDFVLRKVCMRMGWIYGEAWIPSSDGKCLEYSQAWYSNYKYLKGFNGWSKGFIFPHGIGLPGRAWSKKQPVLIRNVRTDTNYLRGTVAGLAGLKAAVAFPLFAGEELVAVIVFYMFEILEKDEQLISFVSSLSVQLGFMLKLKQLKETIRQLAYYDNLTALPNRKLFEDRLNMALAYVCYNKQKLAVLFLEFDTFKIVNNRQSSVAADQLLQLVVDRLKSCMREIDTIARLENDKFALLLPECGEIENSAKFAQKIIKTIKQPLKVGRRKFFITISIGITLFPNDGKDVKTLLENADIAVCHAKENGRNNYQFYRDNQ